MTKRTYQQLAAALGLLIICAAVYLPVLKFNFVNWDDPQYVYDNPSIRSFSKEHIAAWFSEPQVQLYVPAVMASYALDYYSGGSNPETYHRTNFILHLCNVLLAFLILNLFFENYLLSLLGALFFALHPVQVESVAWISERKTLLCAFFSLAAFWAFVRSASAKNKFLKAVPVIFFFLALLSKITAVMLPAVFAVYIYFYKPESFRKYVRGLAVLLLPAAACGILTVILYGNLPGYFKETGWLQIFQHMIAKPFLYFQHLTVPFKLNLFYENPVNSFFATGAFIAICFAVCLSVVKKSKAGFWFLWIVLWLLPVITFIPVPVGDRHLYLPVLGLAGLLIGVFEKKGRILIPVLCLLNALCFFAASRRLNVWKNNETLWTDVLEQYPDHRRANLHLADAHEEARRYDEAIKIYRKLIGIHPEDPIAHVNLANLLLALGRTGEAKKAVSEMETASYAAPYDLYALRAGIAHLEGREEDAFDYLKKAVRAASPNSTVYYTLGRVYFAKQDWKAALTMFEETVRLNPSFSEAYYFAALTSNILKQWNRALDYLKLMRKQDMHHPGALLQEGYAYFNLDQMPQARQAYLESLDQDPANADTFFHLGLIALRQNEKDEAVRYLKQAVSLQPETSQYREILDRLLDSAPRS